MTVPTRTRILLPPHTHGRVHLSPAVDFPYFLYWEVLPNGFMVGQVEANVAGWVGLGISPTGQMDGDGTVGSDIMVFWVGAGASWGLLVWGTGWDLFMGCLGVGGF